MSKDDEVAALEREIKSYNRLLKRHPEDDNCHYVKAGTLLKIAELTNDETYHEKALICYSEAIKIAPYKGIYLVDRSNLYIIMKRLNLAAKDVIAALKLDDDINPIFKMYIYNTVRDLLKLDVIRTELNKLTSYDFEQPINIDDFKMMLAGSELKTDIIDDSSSQTII